MRETWKLVFKRKDRLTPYSIIRDFYGKDSASCFEHVMAFVGSMISNGWEVEERKCVNKHFV